MALKPYALTTWPTMQAELGLSDASKQAVVERLILAVSRAMSQVAYGRSFEFQAGLAELYQATGGARLFVDRYPIKVVSAVNLLNPDGSLAYAFDPVSYQVDTSSGVICRSGSFLAGSGYLGSIGAPGFDYGAATWPWIAQSAGDIRSSPQPATERLALQVCYDAGWVTPQQDLAPDGVTSLGMRDLPEDLEMACILSVESLWARRGRSREISSENLSSGAQASFRDAPSDGGFLLAETTMIAKSYARVM